MESRAERKFGSASLGRLVCTAILWSAPIALWAHVIEQILPFPTGYFGLVESPAVGRFLYYFGTAYLTLIPYLTLRIRNLLVDDPVPNNSPARKLAVSSFVVAVAPAFLALPLLVVHFGPESIGRAKAIYAISVHTIIGLWAFGGLMIFGISLFIWMLTSGLKKLWLTNKG